MMMKNLRHWFAPPALPCDEEDRHRVVLMNGMINAGILFVLLVIFGNLLDRYTLLRNYLIDLFLLAAFLAARSLLRKGKTLAAGISACVLGFVMTVASIVSDGTVRSTAVVLFLLVIVVAGTLYKVMGIVVSTAASSLAVLTLVLAENSGMLPRPDYSVSLLHWFFLTITFAIVAGIVYFSDHVTQQAFRQAKRELAERQRMGSELEIANEELLNRVAEVERLQASLREQSVRDPLTDLYNRRYMDETLSREILRAGRELKPLSVIIGDVDHFKRINDTYGHQVGDLVLAEIARLIKRNMRGSDFSCRYGGEEFLFVLPGADVVAAQKRAEELRLQIERLAIRHQETSLGVTISLGIAAFPVHGGQGDEIIQKADQALYEAKRMGRNAVRTWSGPNVPLEP